MAKDEKGNENVKKKKTLSTKKDVDLKKTVSKNQKTREKKVKEIKQEALELAEAIKDFEEDLIEDEEEIVSAKQKKEKSLFSYITKGLSWLIMAILAIVGIGLLSYIIINKSAQMKGETAPLGLYTIISPSMTPNIQVYDVVLVVKTNPEDIQIGDVVSYYSTKQYFQEQGIPITHRVVEKVNTNSGYVFRTQGDANPIPDDEVIIGNNIAGVVKFVIPQLGRIQFFLASRAGWVIAILVPALGVLIYDVLKLMKLLKARKEMQEVRRALNK